MKHATAFSVSPRSISPKIALGAFGIVVAGILLADGAVAQPYPSRPIKIISPFSAGSPPDALGRLVAQQMSERLGQTVTVENRPGAGSTIATKAGSMADPDGYTLLQANAALAYATAIFPRAGYDPIRNFAPVAMFGSWSHVLVVPASLPVGNVAELIAYAKANPGKLNTGFAPGNPPHVLSELFKAGSGAPLNSVPYRQNPQLIADLLGGRIQVYFGAGAGLFSLVQQGKVKALAYTGVTRHPALSQVPTVLEVGLPQLALNPGDWTGIVAPAGTPANVIAALNTAINGSLKSPEIEASIARQGGQAQPLSPQEFAAFLAAEAKKWPPLVRQAGLKVD